MTILRKALLGASLLATLGTSPGGAADAPAPLALAGDGQQPRAAVGSAGLVAVVYGRGNEIFCRVSKDGGASFAAASRVGQLDSLMLGMRRGPQLALAGDVLVVTAIGRDAGDVVAWRSTDLGKSWDGPRAVSDRPRAAREGLHSLAAGARDTLHVAWLDLRDGATKIFAATSADAGRSWGGNRLVYESPEQTVCECCQPTLAADASGQVAVMWRNSLHGARDMYLARSTDSGRSFGLARKLGEGSWPLRACPMDGGGVAVRGDDVATIWRREDVVYAAVPGAPELALGKGKNGAAAFDASGVQLAWQTAEGELMLKTGDAPPIVVGRGRFPSFGAAPAGRGPVVLTWEDPHLGVLALPLRASLRAGR